MSTDEDNEGTYDAVGMEMEVRDGWGVPRVEALGDFGWCKIRSADGLGNTRLSATVRVWCSGAYSGNLTAIPGQHRDDGDEFRTK
jgi:hypothetical protein